MYEAITDGIRVRVRPQFLERESDPEEDHYFWAYTIEITNLSAGTVRLRARYWQIVDANGRKEEVRGAGVVGEEPVIEPGESYTYTSGVPLSTSSGIMSGSYIMDDEDGEQFTIAIPAFSLDSPDTVRRMN